MADTKISALPASTTPLAGTEVLPIVQSSATKQVSVANLTAGRSVSVADLAVSANNIVPGTAAKGVNFTANTPLAGMTTQLLNWYEEGTWTPTWNGGTITNIVFARYTRIGKLIHCELGVVLGSSVGVSDSTISLPWTGISGAGGGSIGYYSGGATPYLYLIPDSTIFKMRSSAFVGAYTQADMAGTVLYCSFSYIAA